MVIKNTEDSFESFDELVNYISRGGELEFRYKGIEYCIVSSPKGIHISEAYNQDTEVTYHKVNEIGEYMIGNEKLMDVITKLEIIMRLF